jgi:predicted ATPase/DNA-binding SARP family transcriptional activator
MADGLDVRVLGSVEIRRGGAPGTIGGPKPRLLLSMLVAAHGDVVSTDRLCDELWADQRPSDPGAVLQGNISRLRRLLEPEAQIVARPTGYSLVAAETTVDAWRFEARCVAARTEADREVGCQQLQAALVEWGGAPYAEFTDRDWARPEVTRLDELRLMATEALLTMRMENGEDHAMVAELEGLVSEHPLRERPWLLLATALHRTGRSGDALRRVDAFRSILRDELGLDPPAAIRALEARILDSDPTLLGAPPPIPTRQQRPLPAELTALVGRASDVAGIVAGLSAHRLVTLVGPGGVGKTRLALRVAGDVWAARAGHVHLVELAPVHDPASAVASVATAVDVQQRQHLSTEDTLIEFFRGRRALLVLDNCEHLRTAVARLIDRLLAACADLTILVTSREVLGLPVEHVWRVQPLAVAAASAAAFGDIAAAPAVRLFVDRAAASNPGFVLGPDNAAAVADIVRRVDGLPLAIELAAARLRALSPTALAQRLQQRFDLLDHAQFTDTERHSTLSDLVGWSFNLLTVEEQTLFSRVAVFAGGFELDAVESICADDHGDETLFESASVARVLAALVDKSMVQVTDPALGRYRVLEPLREYGRAHAADRVEVGHRHVRWYVELAERAGAALRGPEEAAAAGRLDRDFDNLRAAFSWMLEHGDADGSCRLLVALHEHSFRSMRAEVISWADDVIAMPGFESAPLSPTVLGVAAYGRFVRGDLDGSIRFADLALAAAGRLQTTTMGLAERAHGNAWFYKGDAEVAQRWIDRMLDRARSASDSRLAHALYMRSVAYTSVGDAQRGAELATEGLAVARRSGSPTAMAQASYALGLAFESTDETAAASLLSQAAAVAADAGNRWVQAFALTEVLWLEARRGAPLAALTGFADVIDLWFRGGDWANQWLSLRHVFGILCQVGDDRSAATLHGALTAVGAVYALPFVASDAEQITKSVGTLRDNLGSAEFAAAVRRGAAMGDAEIIDFIRGRIAVLSAH